MSDPIAIVPLPLTAETTVELSAAPAVERPFSVNLGAWQHLITADQAHSLHRALNAALLAYEAETGDMPQWLVFGVIDGEKA